MPFVTVFPQGHALEQRERVTWNDLAGYPFISLQGQFTERLLSDMHGALRDVPLNPANEVTFMTTALAMVSAGLGVTVAEKGADSTLIECPAAEAGNSRRDTLPPPARGETPRSSVE